MKKRERMDIVNGSLWKNILLFSVPLMLSQMLQFLFNSADTIIVGKFAGESALAAVGATGSVVFLLTSLFSGLSTGSNVVIARFLGKNDEKRVRDSVATSIAMALLSGIFLTFFGVFSARTLLRWMDTPEEIIGLSTLYMRIYFLGVIFLLLYNFGSAILRSKGDTKRPLYFMILSGAVNVVLNLFMVIVLHMSVAGVAIATVASEALSAFLVLGALAKEEDATKLDIRRIYADRSIAFEILRIGVPAGLSGVVFALSNVFIQSCINSFDSTAVVAGNAAGANIEEYVYIGYVGVMQATITFTGQCMGAGRTDRIAPIVRVSFFYMCATTILMSALIYGFGPSLLTLYTDEQAVIDVGMIRTYWVARLLVLNGILDVFVYSMRGMGYSTLPTLLMIIGICGVRMIWLAVVFPLKGTLDSIYMCFSVSWIVTLLIEAVLWVFVYRKVRIQSV